MEKEDLQLENRIKFWRISDVPKHGKAHHPWLKTDLVFTRFGLERPAFFLPDTCGYFIEGQLSSYPTHVDISWKRFLRSFGRDIGEINPYGVKEIGIHRDEMDDGMRW
nr:hypothetical protein [Tanacetum cinerariifolium]